MASSIETAEVEVWVTIGVDTHADVHVAVGLDQLGRRLGAIEIPTTTAGYNQLVDWASHFGVIEQFGIEGTSSYGAGLCRWLRAQGLVVIEVDRPDRRTRRFKGKSDPVDAEAAARTVLAGEGRGTPKAQDGQVEQIRVLRVAKRSAVKNRTMAANQMLALVTTAPQALREELRELTITELVEVAAAFRFHDDPDTILHTTKYTLRQLARRYRQLAEQLDRISGQLERLVATTAPKLIDRYGIGEDTAGQLLVTAGDNPDRLHDEAAFANVCGVAPMEASSGEQTRHRLNQGGDRQANSALHHLAVDLEAAGWDGLFVYDHLHLDPAWGLEIYDPWVLLAAVARATSRIRLATAVTPISRRRPWQLAREIVALDHLSGGRVTAGIGLGGLDQFEFKPFGEIATPRDRAPVTDEALTLLDRFLRGEPVNHAGEHFQVQAHLRPAAVQQPRPPIWIAATHPYRKGLERASRWDGVFCNLKVEQDHSTLTPAELQSYLGDLLERPDFDVVTFSHPEHPDSAYEEVGVTWLVEPSSVTGWLEAARERFL